MKFLVVVPTIRQAYPGFDQVIERIRDSFTQPTEFHVLDGKAGKAQTLNKALVELAPASDADVYVTMDDDFVPTRGWQDNVAEAFRSNPQIGSVGIWLGHDPEMLAYMGSHKIDAPKTVGGLVIRYVQNGHHVVGCNVAMRRNVAIEIGPTPETSERYQFWEDGWRGRMVTKLRYRQAFVEAGPVEFVRWQDTKEYMEMREQDITSAQTKVGQIMKESGVGPKFWDRVRNKVRRTFRGK